MVYMISCIVLWICIAVNIYNLRQLIQQRKEYHTTLIAAHNAQITFLEAKEIYDKLTEELRIEQEYFRSLRESEDKARG